MVYRLCFRSLVVDVQNRLKSGGSGSGVEDTKAWAAMHTDVKTLLSKSKVEFVSWYFSTYLFVTTWYMRYRRRREQKNLHTYSFMSQIQPVR